MKSFFKLIFVLLALTPVVFIGIMCPPLLIIAMIGGVIHWLMHRGDKHPHPPHIHHPPHHHHGPPNRGPGRLNLPGN